MNDDEQRALKQFFASYALFREETTRLLLSILQQQRIHQIQIWFLLVTLVLGVLFAAFVVIYGI